MTNMRAETSRFLYTLLLCLLLPFAVLRLLLRSLADCSHRQRLAERFGRMQGESTPVDLWIHAVSLGEVRAVVPLINRLKEERCDLRILVSCGTLTGSKEISRLLGQSVSHCYMPWDLPLFIKRFLDHHCPAMALMVETEIWPNTLSQCTQRGIVCGVVNARLSQRSAARYHRIRWLIEPCIGRLDLILAQDHDSAKRFVALGAQSSAVHVTGSLKFDQVLDSLSLSQAAAIRKRWEMLSGPRPVWIAASVHAGEETVVLGAHADVLEIFPTALLVLVPRHPENFEKGRVACHTHGFRVSRRSSRQPLLRGVNVVLGDSLGELSMLYGACDAAFIGGSIVANGGHNPIEPALWALPILAGPHNENFASISRQFRSKGGKQTVNSSAALASSLRRLFSDSEHRRSLGEANLGIVIRERGALFRQRELLLNSLSVLLP